MMRRTALVGLLSVTAACGTTVPVTQQVGAGSGVPGAYPSSTGAEQQPLAAGGSTATSGTTGSAAAPGSPGPAAAGTTGSTSPLRSTTTSGGSSGAAAPATTLPVTGKGWDAKYVYVGVTTQKDTSRTFSSVGYDGIDPGDTEAQANAVISRINARGGLLGRQVRPVFKDVPLLDSATNPDRYGNSVCTYYSQDKPVVAVINIVLTMDTGSFRACFAKARIPLFNAELTATDQALQSELAGFLYTTVVPTWDALAPVYVDRLAAQGYFQGWDVRLQRVTAGKPKIGVLVLDNPLGARIGRTITKALKARGYSDVVSFAYQYPGNNIGPAVNYFSGNRVTHVISSDIEVLTFQTNASTQQYFPRYGLSSNNNPQGIATAGDRKSQTGSVGVGWSPAYDVAQSQDPGVFSSGQRECLAAMKAGQVVNKGRLAQAFALAVCDGLELFAQGAVAGKHFDAAGVRRGIELIGPRFSTAGTFTSGVRTGRSFLPGGVRDLVWDQPCSCFRYTTTKTAAF